MEESKRREIGVQLAFSNMMGESFLDAARHVLGVAEGQFSCPELKVFLQSELGCKWRGQAFDDEESPLTLADLYAKTRISEAVCFADLNEYKRERFGKGIEIQVCQGDKCPICSKGQHKFRWSEIESLPKVPRHWGCLCLYAAWIL